MRSRSRVHNAERRARAKRQVLTACRWDSAADAWTMPDGVTLTEAELEQMAAEQHKELLLIDICYEFVSPPKPGEMRVKLEF